MNKEHVAVPKTFLSMQRELLAHVNGLALSSCHEESESERHELQDFINQGALAHRTASCHEEWEELWLKVLEKHGLQDDTDISTLAYTPEEDRGCATLKVIH